MTTTTTRPAPGPTTAAAGAGWLGLGAVVSKTCQTAVLLVFAAVLAPAEFGVISLAAVLLNVTVVLADLGTSTALVPFRGDAERAARSALTLALAVSVGLVALVWVAAPWLAATLHLGQQGSGVLRGIVLCLPLAAASGVSAELLRRSLAFRTRVVPDIAGNLLGGVVTVTALAAGAGVFALVVGQLAQAVVVLALYWWLRGPVLPGWSRADVRSLLAFGGSLAGSSLLTLLVLNVDYVLIAHRLGAHDIGVYSMAFRLAYMPYLLIAMVIGGAAFAHLSRMRGAAIGRATVDTAVLVQTLVVPLYVGVLVLAPQLQLLGGAWAPAVPALRWLAIYGLLLSALEIAVVALKSVGRTADILGITAVHLVLLTGLLLAYVDRGVTAAAICQVVAGALSLVVAGVVVVRRIEGLDGRALVGRLVPVTVAAAGLGATALGLQRALPGGPVSATTLVVAGTAGAAVYLVVLRLLDPHDRTGLVRALRLPPLPSLPRRSLGERGWARTAPVAVVGIAAPIVVVALATGAVAVAAPMVALIVLAGAAVLAATLYRVEWAAVLLVVTEPFGDLLREVHPAAVKVVGLLLFGSWAIRLVVSRRTPALRHPGVGAIGVLMLVLLASFVARGADLSIGADHGLSYLAYALVVLVLVDTLRRRGIVTAQRLVVAFLLACTAAGVVGVVTFLAEGGRATGPLEDPNDLAFFLVAAMPFALVARRLRTPWAPWLAGACVAILLVATCATFSRGALLAVLVMVVVALALGALRPAAVAAVGAAAALALAVGWLTHSAVVDRSIAEKEHIAEANVDSRLTTWTMAADMVADSPLLGKGPGGFEASAPDYVPVDVGAVHQTVVHDMYLDVASELGLLGLAAFLAAIGYAVRGAVRARHVRERRALADAVLIAFAGALVAACFLSEQFYLPIWLLVALGIALDPAEPGAEA